MQSGDENAWASLQNGGVLAVGYQSDGAAIYNPATGTWIRTGPVPSGFNTGDTGGISLMFDGRVFVYGLNGAELHLHARRDRRRSGDVGGWARRCSTETRPRTSSRTRCPTARCGAGSSRRPTARASFCSSSIRRRTRCRWRRRRPTQGNPYPIGYVNLPNGQVMVTAANQNWIYTPEHPPQDAWRPTVTSVVYNSDGSYTLTGTQLSGLINGADEGDDMTMAENYPIVWLKDEAGNVYYCRSFAFSNMMPSKGPAPETCQFTTPKNLPAGTYDLYVSAVGVQSKTPVSFTPGVGGMVSDGGTGVASDSGASGDGATSAGDASTSDGGEPNSSTGATGDGGGTDASTGSGGDGAGGAGAGPTTNAPSGCACGMAGDPSSRRGLIAWLALGGLALTELSASSKEPGLSHDPGASSCVGFIASTFREPCSAFGLHGYRSLSSPSRGAHGVRVRPASPTSQVETTAPRRTLATAEAMTSPAAPATRGWGRREGTVRAGGSTGVARPRAVRPYALLEASPAPRDPARRPSKPRRISRRRART